MNFDEFAINLCSLKNFETTGEFENLYRRIEWLELRTVFGVKQQIRSDLKRLKKAAKEGYRPYISKRIKALEALWLFLTEEIGEADILRILARNCFTKDHPYEKNN